MCNISPNHYYLISGGVFGFVAVMHLFRLIDRSVLVIGDWHMPLSFSFLAVVGAGFLCYEGLRLAGVIKGKTK